MTKQQERARLKRRYEKQQAKIARQAAQRAKHRKQGVIIASVLTVLLVLGGVGYWTLARNGEDTTTPDTPAVNAAGCEAPPASLGTGAQLSLPDKAEAEGKTFEATIETNCGEIVIDLDGTAAPQAVASFIQLARTDYWINAPCHRVVTSPSMSLLQCGDPTGTGTGEPGYGFGVENAPSDGTYARGVVAMARTQDPEQGNGGQFFLVNAPTTIADPNGYTVFGQVVKGLDIVDRIVAEGPAGGGTDGAPSAPISILRVAVTEKKA